MPLTQLYIGILPVQSLSHLCPTLLISNDMEQLASESCLRALPPILGPVIECCTWEGLCSSTGTLACWPSQIAVNLQATPLLAWGA